MVSMDLSGRIAVTENRLAALRAKRGAAILDDGDFDAAEYASTEAELAALRDAESIQVNRQRAGARGARDARMAELRGVIDSEERKRLAAIGEAEDNARALVDALKRAMTAGERIAGAYHELTGVGANGFQPLHFENRLSNLLAAVMRGIKPGPAGGRFGHINWPNSMSRERDVWGISEARIVKADLAVIEKKDTSI